MDTHFLEESVAATFMYYFKIQQYWLAENLSHQVLQKSLNTNFIWQIPLALWQNNKLVHNLLNSTAL